MPQFDAIIVPGGGVRDGGCLPVWVERRLDRAIELRGSGYLITLSAGTPYIPPPLDAAGFPIFESAAAANYLLANGVPADRILIETASYDTIGNAYFSRVIHAEPRQLRRILVVTSEFHLQRTEAAFCWIYGLRPNSEYQLSFEATADDGIGSDALVARQAKERRALEALYEVSARIRTMSDLHTWLFSKHDAYAAAKATSTLVDEHLRATY